MRCNVGAISLHPETAQEQIQQIRDCYLADIAPYNALLFEWHQKCSTPRMTVVDGIATLDYEKPEWVENLNLEIERIQLEYSEKYKPYIQF